MHVGAIVPQGWTGEYDGWEAAPAWERTKSVARQAEELGFESIWLFDHVHTTPDPTDELTFESFTTMAALAALTTRVRLGHVVICNGFRNPALVAKMISTLDTISGGRMELGIGAGWKKEEWEAYGYGFPETKDRLGGLEDSLNIITRMLAGERADHATFDGTYASVHGARNVPKPLQRPRVPIMIGGNGQKVTWRLAAQYADELNVDSIYPEDLKAAWPIIEQRCDEVGRDRSTLRVSVHMWADQIKEPGQKRVDWMGAYRELGVSRVMGLVKACATSDEALERFAEDARAAGATLERSAALVG